MSSTSKKTWKTQLWWLHRSQLPSTVHWFGSGSSRVLPRCYPWASTPDATAPWCQSVFVLGEQNIHWWDWINFEPLQSIRDFLLYLSSSVHKLDLELLFANNFVVRFGHLRYGRWLGGHEQCDLQHLVAWWNFESSCSAPYESHLHVALHPHGILMVYLRFLPEKTTARIC